MKAVKCPVCDGRGKLYQDHIDDGIHGRTSEFCHGCKGKGWVEVSDEVAIGANLPLYEDEKHTHPRLERRLGLDGSHCIVDR